MTSLQRSHTQIELDEQHERAEPEIAWARTRVTELQQERKRLARGVVTGTIPGDLARDEHQRIDQELQQANRILGTAEMIYAKIEQTLNKVWVPTTSSALIKHRFGPARCSLR